MEIAFVVGHATKLYLNFGKVCRFALFFFQASLFGLGVEGGGGIS